MADWDTDPLTGRLVVAVPDRQDRPNLPDDHCPFCVGGIEAPEPYEVKAFTNRWPSLPDGRSEVVLYTPQHDATMASLGVDGVAEVVQLWADRTDALGARPDVASVLIFENRGAEVGATITHPHGQIFAFDAVPPAMLPELQGPCSICQERPGDRLVTETSGWRAWVPAAPAWPFELLVVPDAHVGALADVEPAEMAVILIDVLTRLDRLFGEVMPLMLWIHQRPCDGDDWPYAHVHMHIAPTHRAAGTPRFVAAGELGSGVFFNPVPAEAAADRLRAVVL